MLEGSGKPRLFIVRDNQQAAELSDALFDWLTTTTSPAMERASVEQANALGVDPCSLLEACEAIVRAGMTDDAALGLSAIEALHDRRQVAAAPAETQGDRA